MAGDVEAMARQTLILLTDDALRNQFGITAAQDARVRFDLNRQVGAYIEWYNAISKRPKYFSAAPQSGSSEKPFSLKKEIK
jgi:hypothetical protein